MTVEMIKEMKKIDIRTLNRAELTDIRDIVVDESQCAAQRVRSFLQQVGNPFAQKVGDYILVIGYDESSEDTIDDKMLQLARKSTQIVI